MENNDATTVVPLLPGAGPDATALFVHAHPDDETIVTGATMAALAAAGTRVVLVTCTRGELGEVIPPELAHLEVKAADIAAGTHDAGHAGSDSVPAGTVPAGTVPAGTVPAGTGLALERERELAAALKALGVGEHIWLGQGPTAPASGEVTFRDSGMQWGPDGRAMAASTVLPGSLSKAPLAQTAELLAAAIRSLQPTLVVTYAADGGYGHPDHVRVHELTMAALRAAATPSQQAPGWVVPASYAIVSDRPERVLAEGVPRIAVKGNLAAKIPAMQAHRTQITVDGERFALSDDVWRDITAVEEFVALDPATIYGVQAP